MKKKFNHPIAGIGTGLLARLCKTKSSTIDDIERVNDENIQKDILWLRIPELLHFNSYYIFYMKKGRSFAIKIQTIQRLSAHSAVPDPFAPILVRHFSRPRRMNF